MAFYPSWAYNATQPARIVNSTTEFAALPGTGWQYTPIVSTAGTVPDTGLTYTDTRLSQLLVEARVQTMMMSQAFPILDDPQTILRPDVSANDSSITS